MSDILIRCMELPKYGEQRHRITICGNGQVIIDHGTYYEEAEAIELPPHGRLIDADKLGKIIQAQTEIIRKWGIDELTKIADLLGEVFLQEVEDADTIIPADGGETWKN